MLDPILLSNICDILCIIINELNGQFVVVQSDAPQYFIMWSRSTVMGKNDKLTGMGFGDAYITFSILRHYDFF